MSTVLPLMPGGAANAASGYLGPVGTVHIADMTYAPRFGLKGAGALAAFETQSIEVPPINRHCPSGRLQILRLGQNDIMALGPEDAVFAFRSAWQQAPSGYSSWREETWGWLRLTGEGAEKVLRRLTAFDLRPQSFGEDAIAQTRFAHQDGVILRCAGGFDLFFDIASTAQVLGDLHGAATRLVMK